MNNTIFCNAFSLGYGLFLLLLCCCGVSHAQIPITSQGTTYSQDFNTLVNSGSSSTLPAGWALHELLGNANTTYTAGTGSSNTGDTYSFGSASSTERAFGGLQSGTLNPIIGAQFVNQTGSVIQALTITFQGEQWRLGTSGRTDRLDFQISTNATSLNTGTWINFNELDFLAPNATGTVGALDGNLPNNNDFVSAEISGGFSINNNANFWIRWTDFNASGADDGLAIDDFSIYACSGPFSCPPNLMTCLTSGIITLPGSPADGVYTGPGISGNTFNPVAAGLGTHTISFVYGVNSCFQSCEFLITVSTCPPLPFMQWVPLPGGTESGIGNFSCFSDSDCENNILCFSLQYFPSESGTLTSYTTGFYIDCDEGEDPVLSHSSCVMSTSADGATDLCGNPNFQSFFHNFSGANPGDPQVIEGVGVSVHQVCFTIPESGTLTIDEDELTDLTAAITLEGGTFHDDYPSFVNFNFDSITYCGILPVKYASFDVSRAGDFMSSIEWVTTEEINNAYFDVQRSNDGGKTFNSIGQVDASIQPRSLNQYSFIDFEARPGVNYYRLKQVDRDGKFSYSPVRHVSFSTTVFAFKAWPNPALDVLHIYINHAETDGSIRLIDMSGRLVKVEAFHAGDSAHDLVINGLPRGVYSLMVQSGTSLHIEKIITVQ